MEREGGNPTKYLPYLFPDFYEFISHFPLLSNFFSFNLALRSCQYQVTAWLASLPLVTLCLFLAPGAERLPKHICIVYVSFLRSCVMAVW